MGACGWGLGARGDRGSGERTNSGTGESDCRKLPHENVLHSKLNQRTKNYAAILNARLPTTSFDQRHDPAAVYLVDEAETVDVAVEQQHLRLHAE